MAARLLFVAASVVALASGSFRGVQTPDNRPIGLTGNNAGCNCAHSPVFVSQRGYSDAWSCGPDGNKEVSCSCNTTYVASTGGPVRMWVDEINFPSPGESLIVTGGPGTVRCTGSTCPEVISNGDRLHVYFRCQGDKLKWGLANVTMTALIHPTLPPRPSTTSQSASCGAPIRYVDGSLRLTSPNYPAQYPANSHCTWDVYVPRSGGGPMPLLVSFPVFNLETNYDLLTVTTATGTTQCTGTYCANMTSSDGHMRLDFASDSSVAHEGFLANFGVEYPSPTSSAPPPSATPVSSSCGGEINLTRMGSATFGSPGFPSTYPNGVNCAWHINAPAGRRGPDLLIRLIFPHFELEPGADTLEIYDDGQNTHTCTGYQCEVGKDSMFRVRVVFKSDGRNAYKGFQAIASADVCNTIGLLSSSSGDPRDFIACTTLHSQARALRCANGKTFDKTSLLCV